MIWSLFFSPVVIYMSLKYQTGIYIFFINKSWTFDTNGSNTDSKCVKNCQVLTGHNSNVSLTLLWIPCRSNKWCALKNPSKVWSCIASAKFTSSLRLNWDLVILIIALDRVIGIASSWSFFPLEPKSNAHN